MNILWGASQTPGTENQSMKVYNFQDLQHGYHCHVGLCNLTTNKEWKWDQWFSRLVYYSFPHVESHLIFGDCHGGKLSAYLHQAQPASSMNTNEVSLLIFICLQGWASNLRFSQKKEKKRKTSQSAYTPLHYLSSHIGPNNSMSTSQAGSKKLRPILM